MTAQAVRSRVHMMTVAAARLEQAGANPLLIKALREDANRFAGRLSSGERKDIDSEESRIGHQRTKMAMVPDTRAKDTLMAAMLQRAYDLMWDGDCMGCDAIAEFLPSKDVEAMFNAWNNDQGAANPKSKFYSE